MSTPADTAGAAKARCPVFWKVSNYPDALFALLDAKKQASRLAQRPIR